MILPQISVDVTGMKPNPATKEVNDTATEKSHRNDEALPNVSCRSFFTCSMTAEIQSNEVHPGVW